MTLILQAKGYKSKIKPLEEVLNTAVKMEPKLVGYNEVPCLVTAEFGNLTLQQISESSCNINARPLPEILSKNFHAKSKPIRNFVFSDEETEGHSRQAIGCNDRSADSHVTGMDCVNSISNH